jgi:hypothetical protein
MCERPSHCACARLLHTFLYFSQISNKMCYAYLSPLKYTLQKVVRVVESVFSSLRKKKQVRLNNNQEKHSSLVQAFSLSILVPVIVN